MMNWNRIPSLLSVLLVSTACVDKGDTITSSTDPVDADEDGFEAEVDCDDDDPEIYPGAEEVCDGLDNNCNDSVDEGLTVSAWPDEDGDGYGASDGEESSCPGTEGWAENFSDCDDADENVHPAASEVCDEVDNDCNGLTDEGLTGLLYPDVDGDGYGDTDYGEEVCLDRSGWVEEGGDCDDDDDDVHPDAIEECDGLDNDCDELVDLDDPNYQGSLSCDGEATPASDYEGWEIFEYSDGHSFGFRNCELYWNNVGDALDIPSDCVDCEFVFEIEATYIDASSTDDGTCASLMTDLSYTYGYTEDYYGYGSYLMYYDSTYGTFTPWATASFDGDTFIYTYGYEDWDYYGNGNYYTYVWAGEAEID